MPHRAAQRSAPRGAVARVRAPLGWTLLVGGLAVLAWLAWQLWGTSWLAEKRHESLVAELEQRWTAGERLVPAEEGPVAAVVRVPRFGPDFAVPLVEGTSDEALSAGFGRFTDGARPGEPGNFAVAGHRITHGEPLRGMPELEPGDEVVVETAGATHTYRLDTAGDALEVPFDAGWVLDERPRNPDPAGVSAPDDRRLLTLTTCAELFATDQRLVAFGHLVETTPRR